jgi:beta-xylosidase
VSLARRELLALLAAPSAWAADCTDTPGLPYLPPCKPWPKGMEGQRKADQGDGHYLNPVLSGDRPDPKVLTDSDDCMGANANANGLRPPRCGLGLRSALRPEGTARQMRHRQKGIRHVLTPYSRLDATQPWNKFPVQMDVTGYHHNVAAGFASLRPAIYAAGNGEARFSNLRYRALD